VTAKPVTVAQHVVEPFSGAQQQMAPQVGSNGHSYTMQQQLASQQVVSMAPYSNVPRGEAQQQAQPQVLSYAPNLPQPPMSPFVAYSNIPIANPIQAMGGVEQQQVVSSVYPKYVPVFRMRGDGADSFFVEPALENIDSNRSVMMVLGSGSDEEVREMWNFCITSPGTEHSCKQAVDVALHMRCACHLMETGAAKSYVEVGRKLGMLADRKCLNGCAHKHACQAGTFYCTKCVRANKHELGVEECLEKWMAAGSPIRHGTQM
jgi:hypothetical protein